MFNQNVSEKKMLFKAMPTESKKDAARRVVKKIESKKKIEMNIEQIESEIKKLEGGFPMSIAAGKDTSHTPELKKNGDIIPAGKIILKSQVPFPGVAIGNEADALKLKRPLASSA